MPGSIAVRAADAGDLPTWFGVRRERAREHGDVLAAAMGTCAIFARGSSAAGRRVEVGKQPARERQHRPPAVHGDEPVRREPSSGAGRDVETPSGGVMATGRLVPRA